MRISEVAELTGLNASNIRFYEKKGLLTPGRDEESRYRDYSMEDVEDLKRIILYRKMNLPIETIYLLQNEQVSLRSVLKRQEEELSVQKEMLQGAIDLCTKLLEEQDVEQIDIDYYLNYVQEEEDKGKHFAAVEELLEDVDEFADVVYQDLAQSFEGYPYMGKALKDTGKSRGAITIIWFLVFLVLPVISLTGKFGGRGVGFFCTIWLLWLIFAFFRFKKED